MSFETSLLWDHPLFSCFMKSPLSLTDPMTGRGTVGNTRDASKFWKLGLVKIHKIWGDSTPFFFARKKVDPSSWIACPDCVRGDTRCDIYIYKTPRNTTKTREPKNKDPLVSVVRTNSIYSDKTVFIL